MNSSSGEKRKEKVDDREMTLFLDGTLTLKILNRINADEPHINVSAH